MKWTNADVLTSDTDVNTKVSKLKKEVEKLIKDAADLNTRKSKWEKFHIKLRAQSKAELEKTKTQNYTKRITLYKKELTAVQTKMSEFDTFKSGLDALFKRALQTVRKKMQNPCMKLKTNIKDLEALVQKAKEQEGKDKIKGKAREVLNTSTETYKTLKRRWGVLEVEADNTLCGEGIKTFQQVLDEIEPFTGEIDEVHRNVKKTIKSRAQYQTHNWKTTFATSKRKSQR